MICIDWIKIRMTLFLALPAGVMIGLLLGGHPAAWCLLPWAAASVFWWFYLWWTGMLGRVEG
jgi:hypothetical protein